MSSDLPKVMQLVNGRTSIQAQGVSYSKVYQEEQKNV